MDRVDMECDTESLGLFAMLFCWDNGRLNQRNNYYISISEFLMIYL